MLPTSDFAPDRVANIRMAASEEKARLRDKYPLAFRPPSPPLPSLWREMTDDEIMALEIPGVDPNAPPTLHADQVDMAICEKLREIDNNMAAVHSVLAYEILPGLKEYARVTEPIREVSRFWISMFEAACAPKEHPDVPVEPENSVAQTQDATTPTASSTSRTDPQEHTPTASEGPSFAQFNESDGRGRLMTSTPAGRAKKPTSKIFSNRESPEILTTDESLRTRLRRQMEDLRLERTSVDLSDTSTSTPPISPSSISASSLSSFRSKEERSGQATKGKGRAQPDLRAKALQNVAFGAMQKAYGPVFTERPSTSSYNTTLGSDSSAITTDFKHKPSSIFNPGGPPASNNQPPLIFTRRTAPSSTTTAQQRLVQNLLKEAEQDKRTGVPVGASLPSRSPARFNTLRHAVDTANAISLSTDDDTMSTRASVPFHRNPYGNEIFEGTGEDLDDSFTDSDDDEEGEEEEHMGDHGGHLPVMPEQYVMEEEYSSDNTGWQANSNPENRDGITNVFGGGRAAIGGGDFRLRDVYRGAEPDSFIADTPILARHAGARQLG